MTLTRSLQLPPCLWDEGETFGQRLHQATERRVSHHHHLLLVTEEGLQDCTGGLTRDKALEYWTANQTHVSQVVWLLPLRQKSDGWTCCSDRIHPGCRTERIWNIMKKSWFSSKDSTFKCKRLSSVQSPLSHNSRLENKFKLIYCMYTQS